MVKLTVLVVNQDRVSVLYTGHVKEPESIFEKEQGRPCPDFSVSDYVPLYIRPPLDRDGFHQE